MSARASLHVHRSNRTELLVDALAELVATPLADPFAPEIIVVQSRGMATWLNQELARRHGVWAHAEFLFPRKFVQRVCRAVLGEEIAAHGFTHDRLLWAVLAVLPECLLRAPFARLRGYLRDDVQGLRRFQLARRIATTFDQYLTYRPDLLRRWEQGDDGELVRRGQGWQPELWRALGARLGTGHIAAREVELLDALRRGDGVAQLPARVAVFGVASLPPLYVRVLAGLAPHARVHLFLTTAARAGAAPHRLRSSLGALASELDEVLAQACAAAQVGLEEEPRFAPIERASLLQRLQSDLLEGVATTAPPRRRRSSAPRDHPTLPFAPPPADGSPREPPAADASLSLHSCHGPMREVEVLRDQLLDLLAHETGIEPRDVIVMMPDVEAYAPLIEAVFGTDADDPHAIPYHIADRRFRSESPVVDAFVSILALVGRRATASEVLDVLRLEPVHRRFGLAAQDLEQVTQWVVESGIRWGADGDDRGRHGQPATSLNTWRFGLDRLLLGYAMPGAGRAMFAGVVPYDEIEGQSALLLGRLAEFCERLFAQLAALAAPRPLPAWRDDLGALLDALLVQDPDSAWEQQRIRTALAEMVAIAQETGFGGDVDLAVLRGLLEPQIDEAHQERGFLSGGVTFCAFVPMRGIPFEVVCMLGMSDGAFPRAEHPADFDLIANGPRRVGDRQRRSDDRYLFLEALLSARRRVIITYAGQSIRDNTQHPPSVLVTELLEALVPGGGSAARARVEELRKALTVQHPLQAFSRRYFDGREPRLFSYAESYRAGAVSLASARRIAPALFEGPLAPEAEEQPATVALDELLRFVRNPAAYLLRRRLAIDLDDRALEIPDRETLELDGLTRYEVGDRLLARCLDGEGATSLALERGHGLLPPGATGTCAHDEVLATAEKIAVQVRTARGGAALPPLELNHLLPDGTRLVGTLDGRYPQALVLHQFSRVRARHLLAGWVKHLAHALACGPEHPALTVLIGRSVALRPRRAGPQPEKTHAYLWPAVADPGAHLLRLVQWMRAARRAPLRLLPETSMRYALRRTEGRSEREAILAARRSWTSRFGEYQTDPSMRRVFGAFEPPFEEVPTLGPPFEQLALEVFAPLLAVKEEEL